ncbi:hypothetical protein EZJ19_06175 [Parasulfuritortus cantonensis]|uniref:Uncharacterized protein n=2 Tax=Parasulfuritortus cantonensis TaxID=2528202 RepID=A0A4R1BF64_9PROT|nr:hypothetical protein EZJ19_06175 [Parasulfuritortus cantonensis]
MATYLVTIGLILILMLAWVVVQQFYKLFARRHPELGPFRSDNGGCGCCGGGDSCDSGSCHSH